MKLFLPTLILLFSIHASTAQTLTLTNQKSIGGSGDDSQAIYPAPNGQGYFLIGNSNSNISGDKSENSRGMTDLWITRISENFDVIWDKTIGTDNDERFMDVIFEADKIYITVWTWGGQTGEKTEPSYGLTDTWLLCLDTTGNILWQKTYGGDQDESYARLVNYSSTSLLMVVQSRSQISGNKIFPTINGLDDLWLVEVNKLNGAILNQSTIGSNNNNQIPSVIKSTFNNHVYISSISSQGISGDKTDNGFDFNDIWVVELNQNLEVVNDKCFGGIGWEQFSKLFQVNQDIFISANTTTGISGNKTTPNFGASNTEDSWLVKIDHDLNILWDKSYGGSASEGAGYLFVNSNNNIVFTTSSKSLPSGNKTAPRYGLDDSWLLILDQSGNILYQETFGGIGTDFGGIVPAINSNQDLILISSSNSAISGNKTVASKGGFDTWLGKIDASYYLNVPSLSKDNLQITASPNPFQNTVRFQFSEQTENTVLSIYAVDGKKVFEKAIQTGTTSLEWQAATTGQMFFYELRGNETFVQGKLVKM